MTHRPVFPFSAIVGQDLMKKSLVLNAINPRIGGVLIRGEKGTAKSTAVRAFARLLPEIAVVEGCPYSCDPDGANLCQECLARRALGPLPRLHRPVRVVDLTIGATEDRVLGTLDLEHAIREGSRVFEPGLLAAANRGVLYVDEVNLLSDHLVDVLLDAAAMGQNVVEREGVSVAHPAQFILVGTMNPEEGDLRPQLLDRFALAVEVQGLGDPEERAEVVRRRIAFEADPAAFLARWEEQERRERERIRAAQRLLPSVRLDDALLQLIARVCASFGVDGLRADIVIYKTALAHAAYEGRTEVNAHDVRVAAELALPHRRRRQPFDTTDGGREQLDELFRGYEDATIDRGGDGAPAEGGTGDATDARAARPEAEQVFAPDPVSTLPPLGEQRPRRPSNGSPPSRPVSLGPRARGPRIVGIDGPRSGHHVGARLPSGQLTVGNLALDATMRAAAPFQRGRQRARPDGPALRVEPVDLREKVRETKPGQLVLFLVDASGSMAAQQRMRAAKGAALALLLDAYRKRDRVGLIAFRGERAELLLPPTNSVDLAERRLRSLPTGGRTPLAHALELAEATLARHASPDRPTVPWLVVISDGRSNVPRWSGNAVEDALRAAERLRDAGVRALVVDGETGPVRLGLPRRLARALGGDYVRLDDLAAETVHRALRQRLGSPPWGSGTRRGEASVDERAFSPER